MNTTPPTRCPAWPELQALAARWQAAGALRAAFDADAGRAARMTLGAAGLRLCAAHQLLDAPVLESLAALAQQRDLAGWRSAMLRGETINDTEGRAVRHADLRAGDRAPAEVREALERMRTLAQSVRAGRWLGATDRPIRALVHLGTGGSDLGPRLLADALLEQRTPELTLRFAANVDPLDLTRALEGLDPAQTLFVVVSKTFTTQETLENARAARAWLGAGLPRNAVLARHFVAVTSNDAAAQAFGVAQRLPLWDWVGGRYSLWSPVGFSAMCLLGPEVFDAFLAGAAQMDAHFAEAPFEANLPVLMGLISVWNVNMLGARTHAVLPYSTALRLLPAYLQQLEMESNGKQVDRRGEPVDYATAPVVWGAEGTVGQHSFHQLLHQGTQTVPADFVIAEDAPGDPARRRILAAHARAQAEALAFGAHDADRPPHRRFPGGRPSSTIALERLDAQGLGALLAAYEHKVFTQGIIWNLNSFDQWGVELGKQLAGRLLEQG